MTNRRSRLEIIYDLLNSIREKGGSIKPTHLLYKSNLSHKKMMEYTAELMEKGFMEEKEKDGKKIYALTDKGQEYVNEFMRMKRFSESFGL
ncbi:winged helix DNA-binding protein [archaeon]|nr:winged helix DNA-binding protein [archaeon]